MLRVDSWTVMQAIGFTGYLAVSAMFASMSWSLLSKWRGRLDRGALVLTCVLTASWALVAAYYAIKGREPSLNVLGIETLYLIGWLGFLLLIFSTSHDEPARRGRSVVHVAVSTISAIALAALAVEILSLRAGAEISPVALSGHFLALSLICIVMVVAVYWAADPVGKAAALWLAVGLSGMAAGSAVLYGNALLTGELSVRLWYARGLIDAVFALPVLYVTRNLEWSKRIFVSHTIVYYTTVLLSITAYLIVTAVAGYYLGSWLGKYGGPIQAAFYVAALSLLAATAVSGRGRAYIRIFVNKHLFNYKYDYREEWQRFIRTLSMGGPGVHMFERVVQAVSQIVDSPGGVLWVRAEAGDYEPVAQWGRSDVSVKRVAKDSALARFLEEWQWVINVEEYDAEPDLYQDLDLSAWVKLMPDAWLVVPLMQDVQLLAFVVVSRPAVPRRINWEDHDLLKISGRQAATHIAQLMAMEALIEAREFQAFSRLSAFVIHDLKNLIQQLSLIVRNAARHRHNPKFMEDVIATVENSVSKMEHLLAQLRSGTTGRSNQGDVDLVALSREVAVGRSHDLPKPFVKSADDILMVQADRRRLGAVLTHLVQNAQEATPHDGRVTIQLRASDGQALIEIEDNGCGMDARFIRERLFRPFDTTKGQGGMGIGAYQSREYVRELGGDIAVESESGVGTKFIVVLPLMRPTGPSSRSEREQGS